MIYYMTALNPCIIVMRIVWGGVGGGAQISIVSSENDFHLLYIIVIPKLFIFSTIKTTIQ